MKIDEDSIDPLTVARMTDHNVRGVDLDAAPEQPSITSDADGHYDVDGVSLARSNELKVVVASDAQK